MKKFFILALFALSFTSCDFLLSRPSDKYVIEEIANLLEVSTESVDVDFDNMETYDLFLDEKLTGDANDSKVAKIVQEKTSGKYFIVVYDGIDVTSITFAPEK